MKTAGGYLITTKIAESLLKLILSVSSDSEFWRRGRDSNSRSRLRLTRFLPKYNFHKAEARGFEPLMPIKAYPLSKRTH